MEKGVLRLRAEAVSNMGGGFGQNVRVYWTLKRHPQKPTHTTIVNFWLHAVPIALGIPYE